MSLTSNIGRIYIIIIFPFIFRLSRDHEHQVALLRRDKERDLVSLRGELEHERASLVTRHETEQAQLKERARMLERRLGTLDNEYAQQLDNLRAAYRKTLNSGLEGNVHGEDNIRQRYQAEIEQLRVRVSILSILITS